MAATGTLTATLGGLSLAASARVGRHRRELILVRLLAIAGGITGVARAVRNRTNISPIAAGATIVIWNGDEESVSNTTGRGPNFMDMEPVLRVMVEAGADDVGPILNRLLYRLQRKILGDAELRALTGAGPRGDVRYTRLANNIEGGLKIEGEDWVTFTFRYPLLFNEL